MKIEEKEEACHVDLLVLPFDGGVLKVQIQKIQLPDARANMYAQAFHWRK